MNKDSVRVSVRLCPIEDEELLSDLGRFNGATKTSRIRRLLRAGLHALQHGNHPAASVIEPVQGHQSVPAVTPPPLPVDSLSALDAFGFDPAGFHF
jgi:hypothetical protein